MPDVPTAVTQPDPAGRRSRTSQRAVSCTVLVMVWISVLLPRHRATAQQAATAVRTTVGVARARTAMGPRAQPSQAPRHEDAWPRGRRIGQGSEAAREGLGASRVRALRRDVWPPVAVEWEAPATRQVCAQDVQDVPPTSPRCEGGSAAQLTRALQIIQEHDPSDTMLRNAIQWIGQCGTPRTIPPLIQAWHDRNIRQRTAIQRLFRKVSLKDYSAREEAFIAERVTDQILEDLNTALEALGIARDRLLAFNREAVQHGSAKALALLVHYHDQEAIPLLVTLLQQGDEKVAQYHAALEQLGADHEVIFQATLHALAGWNAHATLALLRHAGDQRAIGPLRQLLERADPVHTEAKAVLQQLGARWYDQRSDAERFGCWIGIVVAGRLLWRGGRLLWRLRRRSLSPLRDAHP